MTIDTFDFNKLDANGDGAMDSLDISDSLYTIIFGGMYCHGVFQFCSLNCSPSNYLFFLIDIFLGSSKAHVLLFYKRQL